MSARDLFLHLRLGFALSLAPLFLWGAYLAGGHWDGGFWRGFLAFHLFLYGGANAYNSYYDRDEGPIGGLASPPAVSPALWRAAVGAKSAGLALAATVGPAFVLVYLAFVALSVAYSHPAIRLKGNPWASMAVVGAGQGALGFAGGWATADPALATLGRPAGLLGLAAGFLFTCGFYPLTQVYQLDADRQRGDRTVALALGPGRAFALGATLIACGGLAFGAALAPLTGWGERAALAAYLALVLALVAGWARRFRAGEVMPNFRRAMAMQYANGACLAAYVLARAWLLGPPPR